VHIDELNPEPATRIQCRELLLEPPPSLPEHLCQSVSDTGALADPTDVDYDLAACPGGFLAVGVVSGED
jgi:hypothetical protein